MNSPRIILATGPLHAPGAIVVDHRACCFWRDGERRPPPTSRVPFVRFRVVSTLLLRAEGILPIDELVDAVYGDTADGGPLGAARTLHFLICKSKPELAWLGLRVRGEARRGYHVWRTRASTFVHHVASRRAA